MRTQTYRCYVSRPTDINACIFAPYCVYAIIDCFKNGAAKIKNRCRLDSCLSRGKDIINKNIGNKDTITDKWNEWAVSLMSSMLME